MQIAVLGGGNGAHATAADLGEKPHDIRFWRRDQAAIDRLKAGGRKLVLRDFAGEREVALSVVTSDMADRADIAALGAGRMGRGIAIVFAYAGVSLIDIKPRDEAALAAYEKSAVGEVTSTLSMLAEIGMMGVDQIELIAVRIRFYGHDEASDALARADFVFEGVPETLEAKQSALAYASQYMRPDAILASTTSTILSDTLQEFVAHPKCFLNTHWLNPAYLVPLVEISPGSDTSDTVVQKLKSLLEAIGKVPIICKASPGYIVPRIQALAMNEAAPAGRGGGGER